jgi:VWFA-related protein
MKSVLGLLILSLSASVFGQDAPTFKAQVNLVNLLATVRDRQGRVVTNLTPDDFALEEDGKPQTIRYFSRESDLPLTVGLLVDTSRSQRGVLGEESQASSMFLNQVLREGKDEAFVTHFDTQVETLQGLTGSKSDLSAALQRLEIPDQVATLLYSAVRDSSNQILHNQQGRKACILLTDGVAFRDPTSIGTAIEAAQRADSILFAIRFSDSIEAFRPMRAAIMGTMKERGKADLRRMTEQTGGVAYEVNKNQDISSIYSQIEETLRNQYSIGYVPARGVPDGKYHKIKLTTKNRDLVVETRTGYFAQ